MNRKHSLTQSSHFIQLALTEHTPFTITKMNKGKAERVDIGILITSDASRLVLKIAGITVLRPPVEVVSLYHYLHVKYRRLAPSIKNLLIEFNDSGRTKKIMDG